MNNITVSILEVAGYEHAIRGARLSRNSTGNKEQDFKLALGLVRKAATEGHHSHDKFMRMIQIWMEIRAPRYWWQQFATYRFGVEVQSESTMYTLKDNILTDGHFVEGIDEETIQKLNTAIENDVDIRKLKCMLPEGFLQTRGVMISAAALRQMWIQRKKHKLGEWEDFFEEVKENLQRQSGNGKYICELIFIE